MGGKARVGKSFGIVVVEVISGKVVDVLPGYPYSSCSPRRGSLSGRVCKKRLRCTLWWVPVEQTVFVLLDWAQLVWTITLTIMSRENINIVLFCTLCGVLSLCFVLVFVVDPLFLRMRSFVVVFIFSIQERKSNALNFVNFVVSVGTTKINHEHKWFGRML